MDSLVLRQGTGELRGTGRYDWNARTYTVDIDGQRLTWRGTLPRRSFGAEELPPTEVTAAIALKFAGSGSIDAPAGEGVIDFDVSGGPAGDLVDRGIINVRLNGDDALVTGRIPSLGAFITAQRAAASPFGYEAVIVMNRIDLDPVIAIAGLQSGFVTGTASLSALARGTLSTPATRPSSSTCRTSRPTSRACRSGWRTPSRLSWDARPHRRHARPGGRQGPAAGLGAARGRRHRERALAGTFKGELGELLTIGRPVRRAGAARRRTVRSISNWQSTGGIDQSTATLHLADGSVAWGNLPALGGLVDGRDVRRRRRST